MGQLSTTLLAGSMVFCVGGLAACSHTSSSNGARPVTPSGTVAATVDSGGQMPLSVLVFNVEYGGTPATDAVIADVNADVVGVLESYNRLPKIAAAAGYPYYDVGLQILSRYPILEPSGAHGR